MEGGHIPLCYLGDVEFGCLTPQPCSVLVWPLYGRLCAPDRRALMVSSALSTVPSLWETLGGPALAPHHSIYGGPRGQRLAAVSWAAELGLVS